MLLEIKSTTLGLDREKAESLSKIAGLQSLRLAPVVALTRGDPMVELGVIKSKEKLRQG